MSLMMYVNEEIDERRGLEYIRRNCVSSTVFHQVLSHVWAGQSKAREFTPRGELHFDIAFELVYTGKENRRIVRVRQVTAPPTQRRFTVHHLSTFLVTLDPQGCVDGAYFDSLKD
jgi:hypothetical protein